MLPEMGYSLQANSKTLEGADHPDAMISLSTSTKQQKNSLAQAIR
jgi:hypothetical protein